MFQISPMNLIESVSRKQQMHILTLANVPFDLAHMKYLLQRLVKASNLLQFLILGCGK